ncbi:PolC-type DNA polymerase III [Mycoplasma buteonis]|uniref:PolC-type DNA polymerase III n=1 Tax=Mycoplasma buteonis TaxID=171280 RepID=UPI0005611167|nr:PolC-type DNA polymerase III [Mycoplasma buteonis]
MNKKFKDPAFSKLMEFIGIKFLSDFEYAYVKDSAISLEYDDDNNPYFICTICIPQIPSVEQYLKLHDSIINGKATIKTEYQIISYTIEQPTVAKFFSDLILCHTKLQPLRKYLNNINSLKYSDSKQKWIFNYSELKENLKIDELLYFAEMIMQKLGFKDFYVQPFYVGTQFDHDETSKLLEQINIQIANDEKSNLDNSSTFEKAKKQALSNNYEKNKYRKAEFKSTTITEIQNLPEEAFNMRVAFEGMIYKKDISTFGQTNYYHFYLTDFHEAIKVSVKSNNPETHLQNLKEDDWIYAQGEVRSNVFDNTKTIQVFSDVNIRKIESPIKKRVDDATEKRCEISARSKMSTMDGLLSATEIVNIAKDMGHKAVAILDSNSVQAFPEFVSAAKKAGIKPIYGVTFDVINQNNKAILTEKFVNLDLSKSEVVSFDIETTHLSPKIGDIIEFGGSLVVDGIIKENYQFFMKAKEQLRTFTINLTNITDEMLAEKGLSEKEGLAKIYQILNNRIALAHNANFDMHFIMQKFLDNEMELPNTVFIDSLVISRLVFNDKAKHALGDFCKNLGVEYDSEVAHRADYDAEVLAKAWVSVLGNLRQMGIVDLSSLYSYEQDELRNKTRPTQISVLAKNQEGIKEIFKLVTKSLTERFYKAPKLFWEDIPTNHPNLLIGSSGLKGELIDSVFYSSDFKINQIIDKFDYIEVPHPDALTHLIDENDFTKQHIEKLLTDLIYKAKRKNKVVTAIGDVRYENKDDQIFYKSLVYSKGIGNVPHFLFNYTKAKAGNLKIPNLYYLTTKEMLHQFSFLNDLDLIKEIVIYNPNKIADSIEENLIIIHDKLYTPIFDDSKNKLKELVYKNAHEKYGEELPQIVAERLEKEITPILKYGFDVVYWISHKLVKKSTDNGYLVGSRGSVGSSLIATMAGITEVNPLPPHYVCPSCKHFELSEIEGITSGFDLDDKNCPSCDVLMTKDGQTIPFETFLGFNADKVPDIDLNFSGDFQAEVHNEVKRLFGESHTFRAGTISTIRSKTGFGYIKKACEDYGFKYSNNFMDFLSTKLEGVKRTTGQHPGGIIIIPKEFDVEDFTPSNYPADDISIDWKTTHFDFHAIHDNVLKLDILGHVDPTAIRMLEKLTGLDVKKDVPKKDLKVLSLFSSTKELNITPESIGGEITGALGLPEFGTNFVRRMLYEASPKSFADLISLSGLSHGTDVWTNNAQDLIKNNNMTIKDVISCRDDIMVYLMNKGVDPLQSFKIMEQVRKGKSVNDEQVAELKKHNVPDWYIESMKKIKYMFPKAHATAYVLMAWRIAWFKLYYPLEYYATYLTTRVEEFDIVVLSNDYGCKKINAKLKELEAISSKDRKVKDTELIQTLEIARELYARGFGISNINLNESLAKEWTIDFKAKTLIPPFSSLKGLGISAAEKIVLAREESPFRSKEDFKKRSSINQTLFGALEELGVLKDLDDTDQMTLF